jgi:hypothetical protein
LQYVLLAAGDEAVVVLHTGDARRERAAQFAQGHAAQPDGELLRPLRHADRVGAARVGVGARLADDRDAVIGTDRLTDELVDEAVALELGGIDVIHAEFHGAAQQRGGRVAVVPEVPQLHRAVADAGDAAPG